MHTVTKYHCSTVHSSHNSHVYKAGRFLLDVGIRQPALKVCDTLASRSLVEEFPRDVSRRTSSHENTHRQNLENVIDVRRALFRCHLGTPKSENTVLQLLLGSWNFPGNGSLELVPDHLNWVQVGTL